MDTHAELEQDVWDYLAKWQEELGLNRWLISVKFGVDGELGDGYAGCTANPTYREAVLSFDLDKLVDRGQEAKLEIIVVHELMHCHTAALSELCSWLWDKLLEVVEEGATSDLDRLPIITNRIFGRQDGENGSPGGNQ